MLRIFLGLTLLCGLVASSEARQALSGEASSVCQPCGADRGTQACLPLSAPLVTQLLGDGLLALAADGTVAQLAATACYLDHCTPTSAVDRDQFCTAAAARGSKRLGSSRRLLGDSGGEARAQAPAAGQGTAAAPAAAGAGSWWGAGSGSGSVSKQALPQPCAPPSVLYAGADGQLACCPHPSIVTYNSQGAAVCGSGDSAAAPAGAAAGVPTAASGHVQQSAAETLPAAGFKVDAAGGAGTAKDEYVAQQEANVANSLRTRWQETMDSNTNAANPQATANGPTAQPGTPPGTQARFTSLLQQDTGAVGFQLEADAGQPNTLQYSGGYVDLAGTVGRVVPQVATARVCAALCQADPACVAWTRKAGGASGTLDCTLLTSLQAAAPTPAPLRAAALGKYSAPAKLAARLPSVRYVNPLASAELVESGTKAPDALPAALYGCPYPPVKGAEGDCTPPPSCNCVAGICYGSC